MFYALELRDSVSKEPVGVGRREFGSLPIVANVGDYVPIDGSELKVTRRELHYDETAIRVVIYLSPDTLTAVQ